MAKEKNPEELLAESIEVLKIKLPKIPEEIQKYWGKNPIFIDLGLVGDVAKINPQILTILEDSWFIPVIAPVGVSDAGISLNINADNVAAAVAVALNAEKLLLMTDVDGVKNQKENLIPKLNIKETKDLITKGIATGGMIPKLNCALDALSQGVKTVHIFNGTMQHAILLEIFTDQGVGTLIKP